LKPPDFHPSVLNGDRRQYSLAENSRHVSRFTNIMSAPISCLAELPTEILEQILLHLPGQDIIKMEAVQCIVVIPDDPALTLRCMV